MNLLYYINTLIGSFYKRAVYRDAVIENKESTFGYLLFLVLVCSIPLMIQLVIGGTKFINNEGKFIADQIPELKVENGIVTMDKQSPYFIRSKTGEPLICIDLSDSAEINGLQGNTHLLLTKNKVITNSGGKEKIFDINAVRNMTLNAHKAQHWLSLAWFVYLIVFLFLVIILYVYRIVQAAFNAVIALVISAIIKVKLDFSSLMYITMVAITPVAILASIIWATDFHIPAKGLMGFILAIGYISFGILANKPTPADSNSFHVETNRTENTTTS